MDNVSLTSERRETWVGLGQGAARCENASGAKVWPDKPACLASDGAFTQQAWSLYGVETTSPKGTARDAERSARTANLTESSPNAVG